MTFPLLKAGVGLITTMHVWHSFAWTWNHSKYSRQTTLLPRCATHSCDLDILDYLSPLARSNADQGGPPRAASKFRFNEYAGTAPTSAFRDILDRTIAEVVTERRQIPKTL